MFVDSGLVVGVKKGLICFCCDCDVGDLKYGVGAGTIHFVENNAVRVNCVLIGRLFLFSVDYSI